MIDTGLVVVLTITITMLISVLVLLFYDFEDWCPQVYLIIADCSVSNICIYSESNIDDSNKDPNVKQMSWAINHRWVGVEVGRDCLNKKYFRTYQYFQMGTRGAVVNYFSVARDGGKTKK